MEVARCVIAGAEVVCCFAAYNLKPVVKRVYAVIPVTRAARYVVTAFPKLVGHCAVDKLLHNVADKHAAVVRRDPFERGIERCVEHKPVVNIVGEHLRVEHCRLTKHCPFFNRAFEHAKFAAQFRRGIHVERTDQKRVAHSRKRVRARTVAVYRDGGNVNERGLIGLHSFYFLHQNLRAYLVARDGGFGVLVGARRNNRRHVYDNSRFAYKALYRIAVGHAALDEFDSGSQTFVPFKQFFHALFAVAQQFYFAYVRRVRQLCERGLTHIARNSGDCDCHKQYFLSAYAGLISIVRDNVRGAIFARRGCFVDIVFKFVAERLRFYKLRADYQNIALGQLCFAVGHYVEVAAD